MALNHTAASGQTKDNKAMKNKFILGSALVLALLGGWEPANADHVTPGEAGQTKVNIYDNTNPENGGWNVTIADPFTGGPDPVIGFVNFRPTVPGDLAHAIFVVSLKNGAPNCPYTIELVSVGADPAAGLPPDGQHSGSINPIGALITNAQGNGNSGAILVDVTSLSNVASAGFFTYAHVDVENRNCIEADGTSVDMNEQGASGRMPGQDLSLPVISIGCSLNTMAFGGKSRSESERFARGGFRISSLNRWSRFREI